MNPKQPDFFEIENQYLDDNVCRLIQDYANMFVAIYNKEIVDYDYDEQELEKRVQRKRNQTHRSLISYIPRTYEDYLNKTKNAEDNNFILRELIDSGFLDSILRNLEYP